MGAPVPQLGSFRYAFEQRSKERLHLLSSHRDVHFHHDDDGDDDFDDYDFYDDGRCCFPCRRGFRRAIKKFDLCWGMAREFAVRAWEFGLSDPRNFVFAAKLGFALTLMSLLIFLKEPFKEVSRYSVWAILTVVVVFEFSIGNSFSLFSSSLIQCRSDLIRKRFGSVSLLFLSGSDQTHLFNLNCSNAFRN